MAAELLTRQFTSEITEILRKDNTFAQFSMNDSAFVNNNSVELAHAGSDPSVVIDRSAFPATAAQRTDVATQYVLEELSTDPSHLQFSEELTVAYNKRSSIIMGHTNTLVDVKGDRALFKWTETSLITANRVLTTGSSRKSDAAGSTEDVNALTEADILAGKLLLDGQNVPQENRKLLITPAMLNDILLIANFTRADAYGTSNIPIGFVGQIHGFQVMMRSRVNSYASSGTAGSVTTVKDPAASTAVTDVHSALMWHPNFVRTALGSINVFIRLNDPLFFGDLWSAACRFGGLIARNDLAGVIEIVEDPA